MYGLVPVPTAKSFVTLLNEMVCRMALPVYAVAGLAYRVPNPDEDDQGYKATYGLALKLNATNVLSPFREIP